VSGLWYLGADLGGTQFRMAAVTCEGQLATELVSVPTGPEFGPEDLRRQVASLEATLVARLDGQIAALGLGTAGVVRPGPLSQSTNLPRLNGVDLTALVRTATGHPVALENDARCFTLAEARFGAARGARHVVGVTLGTGVGCGVIVDGKLHHGVGYEAGEVWRIPLRGRPLEESLSGAGVVRHYSALGGQGIGEKDAARVADAARTGDQTARAAWHAFAQDVAFFCDCICALLDPEVVVLGGSLTQSRDVFDESLRVRLGAYQNRVVYGVLGPAAGVIGGAALHMR